MQRAPLTLGRALACAALLVAGAGTSLSAKYGANRSSEECRQHHETYDAAYLDGTLEPAFTTGPPEDCDTPGCVDGFWGVRSRFTEEPSCPRDLVKGLTVWLRRYASDGSDWAKDALLVQPCDLWQVLRGRTTWVIGDSVTEAIGTALSTFMIEYWDKDNWEVTLSADQRVTDGLSYAAHEGVKGGGKRIAHWCFQMGSPEDPGRLCYLKGDRVKRSLHVLNLLPSISKPDDIVLINIGMHYNEMDNLLEDVELLAYSLGRSELPSNIYWVETPPQHYEGPTGMFDVTRPISEQRCYPSGHAQGANFTISADGSLRVEDFSSTSENSTAHEASLQRLLRGGDRNVVTQPVIDAAGIPTLRVWNTSLPLYQFHTHVHMPGEGECADVPCDCTHVCFPSAPQIAMAGLPRLLSSATHLSRQFAPSTRHERS